MTATTSTPRAWPGYGVIWRWHFYAGLFCIPFVIWLATTGAIYLFKPQIEAWLDRPYDGLVITGPRAAPGTIVAAALAAVPDGVLNSYELPPSPDASVRVLVGRGPVVFRAYVHPVSATVLGVVRDDQRPMRRLFYLHGELMLGARGSMLVELAASWAVVMILTGLYLWWPRTAALAGVIYPRLTRGRRVFWRDLHAVAGVWVSAYTLFLLTSGLPWAKSWGNLLKEARRVGGEAVARLDWTTGRDDELAEILAMNTAPDEHAGHGGTDHAAAEARYAALDRIEPTIAALHLTPPVLISPPSKAAAQWTARSDAPNRPRRVNLVLDAATGAIASRTDFHQRPFIDRAVGIGVAAHEGQLFGLLNQLVGLANATGLVALSVSAAVLWWQRRPASVLGAPKPQAYGALPRALIAGIVVMGLVLPMLGLSLLTVRVLEVAVLRRLTATREFLGLAAA